MDSRGVDSIGVDSIGVDSLSPVAGVPAFPLPPPHVGYTSVRLRVRILSVAAIAVGKGSSIPYATRAGLTAATLTSS